MNNRIIKFDKADKLLKLLILIIMSVILFVVLYFGRTFDGSKAEVLIWITLYLTMIALLGFYFFVKVDFHKYVFIFLILLGGITLLVQPILNVPDEVAHFARSELMSRGKFFIPPKEEMHETIQSVIDLGDEYSKIYTQSDIKDEAINYSKADIAHVAASNIPFMYIPQAIGILLAKLLDFNVIWLLWLARFFNLLLYSLIISLAVKITPKLKMLLFFVAVLPMSLQQAASCSPDAMINSIGILLVAYFLYLQNKKDQSISRKEIILFLVLAVLETVFKVSNIFMAGLILIVPGSKFKSKKKSYITKAVLITIVIIIGALYYLYTTTFVPNLEQADYLASIGADSSGQINYIFSHFPEWIQNFGSALIYQANTYIESLNYYGWLDYGYPILTPIMLLVFAKICFQETGVCLNYLNKFLVALMCAGIYFTTCFALYLSWTPVGSAGIDGVQGRYFIPLICMIALLLMNNRKPQHIDENEMKKRQMIDIASIAGMACSMIIIMAVNYY